MGIYGHYLSRNTQYILYTFPQLSVYNWHSFPSNPTYNPLYAYPRTPDPISAHPITANGTDPTPLFGRSNPAPEYLDQHPTPISISNNTPKMFKQPLCKLPYRTPLTKPTPGYQRSLQTKKQHSLPAAYYRGGTSRAVFFKKED